MVNYYIFATFYCFCLYFQCSTCRKDTLVTDGISSLQTNFYVMYMKQKFGEQMRANLNVCYKHSLQPLSFFCK